jgi:hypothetical protein
MTVLLILHRRTAERPPAAVGKTTLDPANTLRRAGAFKLRGRVTRDLRLRGQCPDVGGDLETGEPSITG